MDLESVIKSVHDSENNSSLILVDKPYNITSFGVISFFKRNIAIKKLKIGHAGTLDPLATGLLIICTGKMTKSIDNFQGLPKEYEVEAVFGARTPTYDAEGDLELSQNLIKLESIDLKLIENIIKNKFVGLIDQKPPAYSAIHINGKRAYEMARAGEDFEIPTKQVEVIEFVPISYLVDGYDENQGLKRLSFRIKCSKGTYVRSLINDLGEELGVFGFVSKLRRTKIGEYSVKEALRIEIPENKPK